jgi:DNA replication initiation complex subunit (GINS family)
VAPLEPMNYQLLRRRQDLEKLAPGLTRLEPEFYANLDLYLRGLQEDLALENHRNAGSTKATILADELRNIRNSAEAIFETRQRKVVMAALGASRDAVADRSNMLREEVELFEAVLALIRDTKRRALHGGRGASPPSPPPAVPAAAVPPSAPPTAAPAGASASTPPAPAASVPGSRLLVRVLEDVGAFAASDLRTYHVQKDDVVSLPSDTAKILILRGKAMEVTPA